MSAKKSGHVRAAGAGTVPSCCPVEFQSDLENRVHVMHARSLPAGRRDRGAGGGAGIARPREEGVAVGQASQKAHSKSEGDGGRRRGG
eukprot:1863797-Prymnesium_polylepis.1